MKRNNVKYLDVGTSSRFAPLDGEKLRRKLRKRYDELGVKIKKIKLVSGKSDPVLIFKIKLKKKTQTQDFINSVSRVKDSFNRPFTLFRAQKNARGLRLLVSETDLPTIDLFRIWESIEFKNALQKLEIPIVVGEDFNGEIHIEDLVELKHILIGGMTGYGKSVFLRSLVTTIIMFKSPHQVNLLLFDTGGNNLPIFDSVCPVIQDKKVAAHTIFSLHAEMKYRRENPGDYPYLICVADEAAELLSNFENEKITTKVCEAVSDMLARGRNVKIIWILVTQNTTKGNFPIERVNTPTKIAFHCDDFTHSRMILGHAGAEKLEGKGDLLLKHPDGSGLVRLQGAFADPEGIAKLVSALALMDRDYSYKFRVIQSNSAHNGKEFENVNPSNQGREENLEQDEKLCAAIMLTLGKNKVAAYRLMRDLHIGDEKVSVLINRMEELGIVSELIAKKSREVLCQKPDDLSEKALDLLIENGISLDQIEDAFHKEENDGR